jgi:uncharacterized protein YcfJ
MPQVTELPVEIQKVASKSGKHPPHDITGNKMKAANKFGLVAVALVLATMGTANAAGCLKGAVVGGVAGHYAGHHAVVGAVGGCIVGHHLAKEHAKEQAAQRQAAKWAAARPGV